MAWEGRWLAYPQARRILQYVISELGMSASTQTARPRSSLPHHDATQYRGGGAVAMLTVYLVLLLGVPSTVTIAYASMTFRLG